MKLFNLFILCILGNIYFCEGTKLRIICDDGKNRPSVEEDLGNINLEGINADENIDDLITYIQMYAYLKKGSRDEEKKLYKSLDDKECLSRKFFIWLQNTINSECIKKKIKNLKLPTDYFMYEFNLYTQKNTGSPMNIYEIPKDINTLSLIVVHVSFDYCSYEIKNSKFIENYEKYFDESKLSDYGRIILKFFKKLIKKQGKYFPIGKDKRDIFFISVLGNIGISLREFSNEDHSFSFEIYPACKKKNQLIREIIIKKLSNNKVKNTTEYKVKVDEYCTIQELLDAGILYGIINKIDCFEFYDSENNKLSMDDRIDYIMNLELKAVELNVLKYNPSAVEEKNKYTELNGVTKRDIIDLKEYYAKNIKSKYGTDNNILFKLRLGNDDSKIYTIDNELNDELIEEIKKNADPQISFILEEPKIEEPKIEENKEEENKKKTKIEEPKIEENKEGENTEEHKEEENKEEYIEEENKKKTKIEGPKIEKPKIEEIKKEEIKKEDLKKIELKVVDFKKIKPKEVDLKKEGNTWKVINNSSNSKGWCCRCRS